MNGDKPVYRSGTVCNVFYNGIIVAIPSLSGGQPSYESLCRFDENQKLYGGEWYQQYQNSQLFVNKEEIFRDQWGNIGTPMMNGKPMVNATNPNKPLKHTFTIGDNIAVYYPTAKDWLQVTGGERGLYQEGISRMVSFNNGDGKTLFFPCFKLGNRYEVRVADNLVFGLLNEQLYVLLAVDMNTGLFRVHGGHVEKGESDDQAADREFSEETTFKITDMETISEFTIERRLDPEIQEARRGYVVELPSDNTTPRKPNNATQTPKYKTEMVSVGGQDYILNGNTLLKQYNKKDGYNRMITTVKVRLGFITEKDLRRRGCTNDPTEQLYTLFVHVESLPRLRKQRLFQWDMHSAIIEEGLSFCRKYTEIPEKQKSTRSLISQTFTRWAETNRQLDQHITDIDTRIGVLQAQVSEFKNDIERLMQKQNEVKQIQKEYKRLTTKFTNNLIRSLLLPYDMIEHNKSTEEMSSVDNRLLEIEKIAKQRNVWELHEEEE